MIRQLVEKTEWGELDVLILDMPPGTGDVQLTLLQRLELSGLISVTTPGSLALADATKGRDMFKRMKVGGRGREVWGRGIERQVPAISLAAPLNI